MHDLLAAGLTILALLVVGGAMVIYTNPPRGTHHLPRRRRDRF